MLNKFPALKHMNIPNLITSIAVLLACVCQYLAVHNSIKIAITVFMFVLLLNRLDGVAARRLGQVSELGKELGGLSEVINFLVTPVIISYYMGFRSCYVVIIFGLFMLAGIWRLADFRETGMIEANNKSCFRGLCCTHTSAAFVIFCAIYIRFFTFPVEYLLGPFLIIASGLMISSFLYNKNGLLTILLYVLTPAAVILMWL